jgi:predicted TIM-barrel fold metal-dependent hydrolase
MLSRRDVLLGSVWGGLGLVRGRRSAFPPGQSTRVQIEVPAGACDCHIHVIGDSRRFPFASGRVYTPAPAQVADAVAFHRALGTTRTVVVQPSVYGTDNSCLLDALAQLGSGARGVAVIDDKTPDTSLDSLHRAGVRGIRINLETAGQTNPNVGRSRLQAATAQLGRRDWHIQIFTRPSVIAGIEDLVRASSTPVVFDHFGGTQAAGGIDQPGFQALLRLVRGGHSYVKISGAYRVSTKGPDYSDVVPLAKALIAANPDRILWGTDWPHVNSTPGPGQSASEVLPHLRIDDGRLLNQLAVWAPDAGLRRKILIENPTALYGF